MVQGPGSSSSSSQAAPQSKHGPAPGGPSKGLVGEPNSPWQPATRPGEQYRTLDSVDGKHDWYQWKAPGQTQDSFSRTYKEGGKEVHERLNGDQHKILQHVDQAFSNAKQDGSQPLKDKDGKELGVAVHGKLTPEQLGQLGKAVESLPPALRKHAKEVAVVDQLGKQGVRKDGQTDWTSNTLGKTDSKGKIALDRSVFSDPKLLSETLAHEAGHGLQAEKAPNLGPEWGDRSSVSEYGKTSPGEDFAETAAYVANNWKSLQNGGHGALLRTAGEPIPGAAERGSDITHRPSATKILQVLRAMDWQSSGQN